MRDWKQFLVDRGDQPYSVTERTFYHWHNENAGQMELWEDMHRIYNDHIDEWRGVRALSPSQI